MSPLKHIATLSMVLMLGACSSTSSPPAATAQNPAPASSTATSSDAAKTASSSSQNLVDPAAIQSLKDMGAYLRSLRRYEVSLDLTGERVLQDGQKLMHSATADLQVAAPNRIRATTTTATSRRVLTYDGRRVSLLFPDSNYYSTVDFSGTVAELIDKLETNYRIEFPAADLFKWGTAAAPVTDIQSAMNAGQAIVGNTLCDHYAFRQPGIDWQIWLRAEGDRVPMKLVITSLGDEARPQSTTVFHWDFNPSFRDSVFSFVPPSGAKAIDMVAAKNAQR